MCSAISSDAMFLSSLKNWVEKSQTDKSSPGTGAPSLVYFHKDNLSQRPCQGRSCQGIQGTYLGRLCWIKFPLKTPVLLKLHIRKQFKKQTQANSYYQAPAKAHTYQAIYCLPLFFLACWFGWFHLPWLNTHPNNDCKG